MVDRIIGHIAGIQAKAMTLGMPVIPGAQNRAAWHGVLVPLSPAISDNAPHGTGGKRISLLASAAHKAAPTLLGMPIDVSADFTSHSKHKVGIISSAEVKDNAIHVAGILFDDAFPAEVAAIRANKDSLGMSFEAREIAVTDMSAPILEIASLTFIGASILKRASAAYSLTSLAASKQGAATMPTPQELLDQAKRLEEQAAELRIAAAGSLSASADISAAAALASLPQHEARELVSTLKRYGLQGELTEQGGISWTHLEKVMAAANVPGRDGIFIKQGLAHFGRLRAA